jgi:DNA-binding HxlR family transcriptional regulator
MDLHPVGPGLCSVRMKGYGQFCPVAKTAEVFAERWTPLIIRELCCGPALFNDLRRRLPLISKTLLTQRLRELEASGIISIADKQRGRGHIYGLTEAGEEFRPIIEMMSLWGQRHAQKTVKRDEFDPLFLLMSVRSQVPRSMLPAKRLVVGFEFRGLPKSHALAKRWWLVFAHPDIDLCLKDPGHPVNVTIAADLETFSRAWLGYLGLEDDKARSGIRFQGEPSDIERVKALLWLSDRPRERRFIFGPAEAVEALRA